MNQVGSAGLPQKSAGKPDALHTLREVRGARAGPDAGLIVGRGIARSVWSAGACSRFLPGRTSLRKKAPASRTHSIRCARTATPELVLTPGLVVGPRSCAKRLECASLLPLFTGTRIPPQKSAGQPDALHTLREDRDARAGPGAGLVVGRGLREAFGVRELAPAFYRDAYPSAKKRRQAGRTPYAARGPRRPSWS